MAARTLKLIAVAFIAACVFQSPAFAQAQEPERQLVRPVSSTPTAVIVIHGGGWWSCNPSQVRPVCDVLRPYVDTYAPEYTLSMVSPFPQANRDLKAYVENLRSIGYERILAVGVSAGGNLAAFLAQHDLVDGFVSWSAPTDLRRFDWYRRTPGWVVERFAPTRRKKIRASPALHSITAPGLIIHSEAEWMPLFMARRLHAAAPASDLVVLPGTAHGMVYFDLAMPITLQWILNDLS